MQGAGPLLVLGTLELESALEDVGGWAEERAGLVLVPLDLLEWAGLARVP